MGSKRKQFYNYQKRRDQVMNNGGNENAQVEMRNDKYEISLTRKIEMDT